MQAMPMCVPVWAANLAAQFWAEAGAVEPFPRRLRAAVRRVAVLDIVELPGLDIEGVRSWLAGLRIDCDMGAANRRLRAALVARADAAFAFLDAGDAEDERRFSLAHEIAHYLRDYGQPRRRAEHQLGPTARDVLEGKRQTGVAERLACLLGRVDMTFTVHLLERDEVNQPITAGIAQAEADADRLAFELLAPADDVAGRLSTTCEQPVSRSALTRLLQTEYGLPRRQADKYAQLLIPVPPPQDPLLAALKTAVAKRAQGET